MTGTAPIRKVILESGSRNRALSNAILKRLPGVPVQSPRSRDREDPFAGIDPGKSTLHLLPYQGEFLKPCPGTKNYICCGYQILNVGTNCPMDCSYCILQAYFNHPYLRVFTNLAEELDHVLARIDRNPHRIFRVGTGEFTDSLALEPLTRWSGLILAPFSERKNAILELKTKTVHIGGLLDAPVRDRIVVSWSLNSPFIVKNEEHGAAGLRSRLEAARRCQSEGFALGFHFDPLVLHSNWQEGYLRTLDLMDHYLEPKNIIWISLGSFRYMPDLKPIIRKRHPRTCVLDGEFIMGLDGKMRYFKPLRTALYAFMGEHLSRWSPDLGLYLCMESHDVWQASLGWSPKESKGLSDYLDQRVLRIFGGNPKEDVI